MNSVKITAQQAFLLVSDSRVQEAFALLNLNSKVSFEGNRLLISDQSGEVVIHLLESEIPREDLAGRLFMGLREFEALTLVLGSVGFRFGRALHARLERDALSLSQHDLQFRAAVVEEQVQRMASDMGGSVVAGYLRQLLGRFEHIPAIPFAQHDQHRTLALATTPLCAVNQG